MVKLIVAAVILIIIMLVFVFILFKNIIKRIDENAKKYFVNKMQSYDYILEEKQTKLEEIKNEIEEIKSENKNILRAKEGYEESDDSYMFETNNENQKQKNNEELESNETNRNIDKNQIKYNLKEPEYRDTQFFNNYKELKKIFTVNNEQIIRDFIEKHKNAKEEREYKVLKRIKEQFDDEAIYGCLTLSVDSQKELLSEVLKEQEKKAINLDKLLEKENFNIKDLIKYVDDRMEQIEPTIYIYVNGVANNYDFIDKNIITKQYSNMSEGIIIKYRNKIYDYSI